MPLMMLSGGCRCLHDRPSRFVEVAACFKMLWARVDSGCMHWLVGAKLNERRQSVCSRSVYSPLPRHEWNGNKLQPRDVTRSWAELTLESNTPHPPSTGASTPRKHLALCGQDTGFKRCHCYTGTQTIRFWAILEKKKETRLAQCCYYGQGAAAAAVSACIPK